MGQREEDIVRAFLDAQFEGDIERTLEYLARDCEWRLNQWSEPLRGVDAFRSELERLLATMSDMRYELLNVASTDHVVFTERIDTQYITHVSRDVEVHIVGVFELGPDGKIVSEREYFDMKEVEAQMKTETEGA